MRVSSVLPGMEIKNRAHNSNSETRFLTLKPTQARRDYSTAHGKRKNGVLGMKEESRGTVDSSRMLLLYTLSYSKKLLLHVQGIEIYRLESLRGGEGSYGLQSGSLKLTEHRHVPRVPLYVQAWVHEFWTSNFWSADHCRVPS